MDLKDGNLRIREVVAADAPLLCRWWNDGNVMAHAGFPNGLGTTEGEVLRLLTSGEPSQHRFILEADSRPIGEMNYRQINPKTAEIGIKICDFSLHGKGYGTRFLRLLITYLFKEKGYERVVLDTNVKNVRAQHVYEKLGFRRVGVRENAWRDQLGELQSFIDYELTPADFFSGLAESTE